MVGSQTGLSVLNSNHEIIKNPFVLQVIIGKPRPQTSHKHQVADTHTASRCRVGLSARYIPIGQKRDKVRLTEF